MSLVCTGHAYCTFNSVACVADSVAPVGDCARCAHFLVFIKNGLYLDNQTPWSKSKSEPSLQNVKSPDLQAAASFVSSLPARVVSPSFSLLPCKLICLSNCSLCYFRSS